MTRWPEQVASNLASSIKTIGGSRGGVPGTHPPQWSRFFRFDIQNFRKVTASGVRGPRHPTGNPGSATENSVICTH